MTSGNQKQHSSHSHDLRRSSDLKAVSDLRLIWAVVLNQLLTIGQVIAGVLSGSVALLSDAAHNFNDANALLIAWLARRISRKQANEQFTFGYRRAELIGAVINLTSLALIGLYLIYEAISRFIEPQEIGGQLMAWAAVSALIIDAGTAWLLWSMSEGSLNVRTAFIHNLVDVLGSLAVLLGAVLILWLDWTWIDPLLTLLIAGYVLWQVVRMLPQAVRILMEGAPAEFDLEGLITRLRQIEGVEDLHHLHIWELDESHRALEAHVLIQRSDAAELESIKDRLKTALKEDCEITHSTLEFEFLESDLNCSDDALIPEH